MAHRFLEILFTSGAFLKWLLDYWKVYSPLIHLWSVLEGAPRFLEILFTSGAFLKWLLDFWKVYDSPPPFCNKIVLFACFR